MFGFFCQQYNAKLFYLESNKEDACILIGGLEYEPPEFVKCTLQNLNFFSTGYI